MTDTNEGVQARRPNVLVIMCDQFRFDAIGAHANPFIDTPHLDALVRSGASFARAYTESPVCVPARATALTGRLAHKSGVTNNNRPLPPGAPTMASVLSGNGYHCQAIGKMHFRPARTGHGFDDLWLSEEIPDSAADDDYLTFLQAAGFGYVREPHGVRHELYYSPQPSQLPEALTTTAWTGRRTVDYLRERGSDRQPFLCVTSFIKPHPPFDPPLPWSLKYDPLLMPDPVRSDEERGRLLHQIHTQHRSKWTSPDLDTNRIRSIRAYYYALVSHVDHWIGKILRELHMAGLRENTLVIFTADHGEYLGDHWAFGKRGYHDAAARIPLVLSWPGVVPAGVRPAALVGLADVAVTVTSAAGCSPPSSDVDGMDLLPLTRDPSLPGRDLLIGQFDEGELGLYFCTDGDHKYIYSVPDERELILAVGTGQDETRDLSGDLAHRDVLNELRGSIVDRFRADGYEAPLDGDTWRRYPPRAAGAGGPSDRSPAGRGRQYARWPDTTTISRPLDLLQQDASDSARAVGSDPPEDGACPGTTCRPRGLSTPRGHT